MKKMQLLPAALLMMVVIAISSCTSQSKVAGPLGTSGDLKGTWTLNDVAIDGADKSKVKITVFDDALLSCFIGSQWTLIQNGNGSYTIQSSEPNCNAGERKIYWSLQTINNVRYFQFKKLFEGEKPKSVTDGFRLELKALSANAMTLQSAANLDGKTIYLNYQFSK
ncbi:lipocalin family protein [Foetidibacter luteolus]|uniref:lipocalin family protein n=1 Tax=Foetidibacter luteolus TaxID=2608880 RepID=UPI001A986E98|nr:lipocalin family protein [Foetidibacter luteolus]